MKEKPLFFESPSALRAWFEKHHDQRQEVWIGYYKKATKIPSVDWSQSVDEALCFGWIDGLRKTIDEKRYKIRFTPRNPKSHWSAVNLEKVRVLKKRGLMKPTGMAVYEKRNKGRSKGASFERKTVLLDPVYEKQIRRNRKAWQFYERLAASYKKASIHWVMSAKREETRLRRLTILIQSCEAEQKIPPLRI